MATPEDDRGRERLDPVYESLFRPEDLELPEPPDDHEPDLYEELPPVAEPVADAEPEPEKPEAELPEPAGPTVDTGRLFRSQGVTGDSTAVLALSSDHGGKLKTLVRADDDTRLPAPAGNAVGATRTVLIDDLESMPDDSDVAPPRSDRQRHRATREIEQKSAGISAGAVYLIVIGLTFVVGLLNAWIGSGELGAPTGIALLVASVYCALRVRREDDLVAIITPPIAFFIAALTAGQMFRGSTGGGLLNRAQLVFFTMAYNWYWVIGTTVIVVVIVLVRRRR